MTFFFFYLQNEKRAEHSRHRQTRNDKATEKSQDFNLQDFEVDLNDLPRFDRIKSDLFHKFT